MLDVEVIIIFFFIGLNFKKLFRGFNNYDKKVLNYLFFYHLLFGVAYYFFALNNPADATSYWYVPKKYGFDVVAAEIAKHSASGYVYLINYIPSNILNLSYFTGFIIYCVFGYCSYVIFYKTLKENIPDFSRLKKFKLFSIPVFPLILFLPNLHFWTSGIGKDTILFFCSVVFIYAIKKFKKRFLLIIISFALSIFIRPHILLFLLTALGLSAFFDSRLKVYYKVLMAVAFAIGAAVIIPYVLNMTKMESLGTESFENFTNKKANDLSQAPGTSSAIDINSYPYPLKVFTFLFRPLFFDAPTVLGLVASLENLIYLLFFIKLFKYKPFNKFKRSPLTVKTAVFFFIIGSLTFPLILGNLGIILRQKTPFMVMFLFYGFYLISQRQNLLIKEYNKNYPRRIVNNNQ